LPRNPPALVPSLADHAHAGSFDELRICYMRPTPHTAATLLRLELMDVITPHPFCMGPGERALTREATAAGRKAVYFVPASFSEIPRIIREQLTPDVFLLQVAPMSRAGWFSCGLTGAYSLAGIEHAKRLILEVNPNLPRSHGKASRIVPRLQGPATDPRIDTQYIVTEHGLCNIRGKSSAERALGLIESADPAFRDELTEAARDMHLV
jgi:acyl-CoA hydrolase